MYKRQDEQRALFVCGVHEYLRALARLNIFISHVEYAHIVTYVPHMLSTRGDDIYIPELSSDALGERDGARLDVYKRQLLMEHEGIVIRKAQIEQRRLAGDDKMEAVVRGSSLETLADLETLLAEEGGSVELLHLVDAGDTCGERDSAEPVAAGIGQAADGRCV